jgi:hypothetical protein
MRKCERGRLRRGPDERGAVLIELSISLLLLVVIAAAIVEYGGLFGTTVDVAGMVRSGARAGTATSEYVQDDHEIVLAIVDAPGAKRSDIERIAIFRAAPGQTRPNPSCLASYPPAAGAGCNVYRPQDFDLDAQHLAALPGARGWPVGQRVAGRDYLGVYVEVHHTPLIDLVWSPGHFRDSFVMRLDPATPPSPGSGTSGWGSGTDTPLPWNWNWNCWDDGCQGDGQPDDNPVGGPGGSA